jgi:hypothetical protein
MSKDALFPPAEVTVVAISFEQAVAAFREECARLQLHSPDANDDDALEAFR